MVAITPEQRSAIDNLLLLVNQPPKSSDAEIDLLDISCLPINLTDVCFAIYCAALILSRRGPNCFNAAANILQSLANCNTCNLDLSSLFNQTPAKIWVGGVNGSFNSGDCCL